MAAGRYDFTIEQGEDFRRVITWKDSNGTAINNTGYAATLQARRKIDDVTPVISLSVGSGISLGGANGQFTITIDDTVTAAYNFTDLVYNMEVTPPAGDKRRLLKGYISLDKEVSR